MVTSVLTLPTPYYDKDGITIYNADCREVLPFLEPVDLVLTDPPYGIGEAAGRNKKRGGKFRGKLIPARDYGYSEWDNQRGDIGAINHARHISQFQCIWGGNYFADILPAVPSWLVWDKRNGDTDFADCELAWTNYGCAVRKIEHLWHGMLREGKEQRFHPTQKPLKVMTWCISLCKKAETILDPFMGVGTTLVAAKLLGKKAIGIEISEEYCRIAVQRLAQGVMDFSGED